MTARDDDDPIARRRRREEEAAQEERERREAEARKKGPGKGGASGRAGATGGAADADFLSTGGDDAEKINELLSRAEPLIEQVNALYGQYFAGVEKRPPLESRKRLDDLMAMLQNIHKPTPAYRFRAQTLLSSYVTHRDRWEKQLRALEK